VADRQRQGGCVVRAGFHRMHRPAAAGRAAAADDLAASVVQGHGHLRQGQAQAVAAPLGVRLLPGPHAEEGRLPLGRGQRVQGAALGVREARARDSLPVEPRHHPLDVHPHLAAAGHGEEGHVAAVGRVEADAGGPIDQLRLAVDARPQDDVPGADAEMSGQQAAQDRPRRHEAVAVARHPEGLGAPLLVGREEREQPVRRPGVRAQVGQPDVDVVRRQGRPG
jgi:hypothetical protein